MSSLMLLYDLGFFNFPRDISIEQTSDEMGITRGYISKLVRDVQKTMLDGYRNDCLG